MALTDESGYVVLHVRDLHNDGTLAERSVVLTSPDWFVKIGRGSMSSNEGLQPSMANTTFDSRVMSRDHAKFSANPQTKEVFVTDVGSMHGTHLAGRRLKTEEFAKLSPHDIITFGVDVSRGSSSFKPVKVSVDWTWYDYGAESLKDNLPTAQTGRNSFTAEYSDNDAFGDDIEEYQAYTEWDREALVPENQHEEEQEEDPAINVVEDSLRSPSVEVIVPPSRTFTVPDSDVSDANSYVSSSEESSDESPSSSPVSATQVVEGREKTPQHSNMSADTPLQIEIELPAAPIHSKIGPADVIMWSSGCLNSSHDGADNHHNHPCPLPTEANPIDPRPIRSTCAELPEATHLDTLALPQDRDHAHRAPSPSDAAMAKSSNSEMPRAPPFIQSPDTVQGMFQYPEHPETRSASAWAGHNSVLYDYGAGHQDACVKEGPSYYQEWTGRSPRNPLTLPPLDPNRALTVTEPLPSSEGNHALQEKQPHKRKADHISLGNLSVHAANEFPHLWETIKDDLGPINDAELELRAQSASRPHLADIPVETTEVDDQPARKKVKANVTRTAEPRGNITGGAVKLAVAAIAGVAIGAIGTVIGLAALPPIA